MQHFTANPRKIQFCPFLLEESVFRNISSSPLRCTSQVFITCLGDGSWHRHNTEGDFFPPFLSLTGAAQWAAGSLDSLAWSIWKMNAGCSALIICHGDCTALLCSVVFASPPLPTSYLLTFQLEKMLVTGITIICLWELRHYDYKLGHYLGSTTVYSWTSWAGWTLTLTTSQLKDTA